MVTTGGSGDEAGDFLFTGDGGFWEGGGVYKQMMIIWIAYSCMYMYIVF